MSSTEDTNLSSLLYRAASATQERGVRYETGSGGSPARITYRTLLERATKKAQKIRQIPGIEDGSVVLLHFDDVLDGIMWFWSTVLAGYLPALSPPFSSDEKQHEKHINHLYELLGAPTVITSEKFTPRFTGQISSSVYTTTDILALDATSPKIGNLPNAKHGDENAVLMLTSGSTGQAKAVCLRNNQILNAVKGKVDCHATMEDDVFLNWINLDHVANLTESHLHALYLNAEQIHVNSSQLLANPTCYLEIISRYRVTFSFAPNFFLNSLSRSLRDDMLWKGGKPDLSSLRTITSGGEALVVKTCETLLSQLHPYGCPENLIVPGFGMTETCAGVIHNLSFPVYDRKIGLEFASLGTCHDGVLMRIVDDEGTVCPAGVAGQLQLSGPSVFIEYFNNASATSAAFTSDGWFITGDIAVVDSDGMLRLVGRSKDVVNINGVKYPLPSLTAALEDANIPGITPSFTVVFDHRPPGQETESLVVLYLPAYSPDDDKSRADTDDEVVRTILLNCGTRPYAVIPLNTALLQKTSLGKLSAGKLRTAFEEGRFDEAARAHKSLVAAYRASAREQPMTETGRIIQKVMASILEIDPLELGATDGLLDQGINSMHLIRLKKELQDALDIPDIPMVTLLTNGSIHSLAEALSPPRPASPPSDITSPSSGSSTPPQKEYMPVVTFRKTGPGVPLWLVHPGAGEILVYLQLTSFFTDRPVYALRARGFDGEPFFETLEECIETYVAHIKRVQPHGPYAVVGYSFGGMFAFEIAKRLDGLARADGGEGVRFLGVLNLPPHVKQRIRQLNMVTAVLTLALFLQLVPDDDPEAFDPNIHNMTYMDVLEEVFRRAPQDRIRELDINREKLLRWAEVSNALHALAWDYEPSGCVESMDVFCAVPLRAVAKSKQEWREKQLVRWNDFVGKRGVSFHDVAGEHFSMIGSEHVGTFQMKLKEVMRARGV